VSIDLHVHSTASDGTLTPAALVTEAKRRGLKGIAICDHDSVEGVAEGLAAAGRVGVALVPAVELTASDAGRDMHILGYRIDPTHPRLLKRLRELRERRKQRALLMIEALREGGYGLDPGDVMRMAGGGSVGRAHIARALAEKGKVGSAGDAFRELIGHGGPYYVPKPGMSPGEVITLIRDSCGIAVLAHPGVSRVDDLIGALQEQGLAGIEVWHSEHAARDTKRYGDIARLRGLLRTGGSDYHGPHASGGGKCVGCVEVPDDALTALYAYDRTTC
jgi:predicted metal-dependent phosphoesterase TrpH